MTLTHLPCLTPGGREEGMLCRTKASLDTVRVIRCSQSKRYGATLEGRTYTNSKQIRDFVTEEVLYLPWRKSRALDSESVLWTQSQCWWSKISIWVWSCKEPSHVSYLFNADFSRFQCVWVHLEESEDTLVPLASHLAGFRTPWLGDAHLHPPCSDRCPARGSISVWLTDYTGMFHQGFSQRFTLSILKILVVN